MGVRLILGVAESHCGLWGRGYLGTELQGDVAGRPVRKAAWVKQI